MFMVHLLNMWDEKVIVCFEIIGFLPFKIIVTYQAMQILSQLMLTSVAFCLFLFDKFLVITCNAMPYLAIQAQMTMAASTSLCKHMDKAISCIQEKLVADRTGEATRGMNMSRFVEVWTSCKALTRDITCVSLSTSMRGMNMSGLVEVWSSCKALTRDITYVSLSTSMRGHMDLELIAGPKGYFTYMTCAVQLVLGISNSALNWSNYTSDRIDGPR